MKSWFTVVLLSCAVVASACSPTAVAPAQSPAPPPSPTVPPAAAAPIAAPDAFPITVTDNAGRKLVIPSSPRRIVSLSASNTEILFALGLEDRIAGVDNYSDYPEAARNKPKVGGFSRPDLEKIVALEPDLVFGTGIHVKATLGELESRGLKVLISDPVTVQDVLDTIATAGLVTGRKAEAAALVEKIRSGVAAVEERSKAAKPVSVFYELSPELHSVGPGTYVNDLIRIAGGTNIAAGAGKDWPQMNQESILLADPEVILLADHTAGVLPEHVAARPGWGGIAAVKAGRVISVTPDLTNRPGPRVVQGLEQIARALHPELWK